MTGIAIFQNKTFCYLLIMGLTLLVIGVQSLFGYKKWKAAGWVLPLTLLGFVLYCAFRGLMKFNVRDILMPLLGLLALGMLWQRGADRAEQKRQKELEKMKAKDHLE